MKAIIIDKPSALANIIENKPNYMLEINGVTLLERITSQLLACAVNDIFVATSNNVDLKQVRTISAFDIGNLLNDLEDDLIIIDSNIVINEDDSNSLISSSNNTVLVDEYKSWMTTNQIETNNDIITKVIDNNDVDHNKLLNSYKLVGAVKLSASTIKKINFALVDDVNSLIKQLLAGECEIHVLKVKGIFHEINDLQDYQMAQNDFSNDEKLQEEMFSCWGGYWRYPEYLDYFYLVTPYYPPTGLLEEIKANFETLICQYPSGLRVNSLLAAKEFNVAVENIIIGNGASELIKSLMKRISGKTGFIKPTFEEYANRYDINDSVDYVVDNDSFSYDSEDLITFFKDKDIKNLVVVNPDNPSGNYIRKVSMLNLIRFCKEKGINLIVDESFVDFADEEDSSLIDKEILHNYPNVYVIKSISKSYGVPGLRLGVLASGDKETIAWMKKDVAIWNINSFAEFYMQISNKYKKEYLLSLDLLKQERNFFQQQLATIKDVRVINSQANYVMVEILGGIQSEMVKQAMFKQEKILIKTLNKKIHSNRQFIRLAIRNHEDNEKFIESFKRVMGSMTKGGQ